MFHKIKEVYPLPNYILNVHFVEGVIKAYDMNLVFTKIPEFQVLQNDLQLFNNVTVDTGGYGISWNDDLDLSCDELWDRGIKLQSVFDGLLAISDATRLWHLNESTLRKAISYRKLIPGVDTCKLGKQWHVSYEAMIREYGQPLDK